MEDLSIYKKVGTEIKGIEQMIVRLSIACLTDDFERVKTYGREISKAGERISSIVEESLK